MELKEITGLIKNIKLLVMDVDGTLTDASVYYSANGEELKKFNIRDGMGVVLLRRGGIETAIITSENSAPVVSRAAKLKIEHVVLESRNKKQSLIDLAERLAIPLENIAYIGDDVNDLQAMQIAGFSACPFDSVNDIKNIANYVCINKGGNGAVRELAELILITQDKSITLPENW